MKIISESPTQLVLNEKPISLALFGFVFIGVGIFVFATSVTKELIGTIVSVVFGIAGIIMIVLTKFITITIDRPTNKINLKSIGLIGKSSQDIAIDQIGEVVISENISQQAQNSQSSLNFTLIFYLKSGNSIPVPMGSANSGISVNGIPLNIFSGRNKQIEIGQKIASFIGVPFKDNRAPTFSEMIGTVTQMVNQKQEETTQQVTPPLSG